MLERVGRQFVDDEGNRNGSLIGDPQRLAAELHDQFRAPDRCFQILAQAL